MKIKNNHAHVTTQRVLNKFTEINFSVKCMVWLRFCLFQDLTTSKNIDIKMAALATKVEDTNLKIHHQ